MHDGGGRAPARRPGAAEKLHPGDIAPRGFPPTGALLSFSTGPQRCAAGPVAPRPRANDLVGGVLADSVLQMYVSLAPVIIAGVLNMVWCSTSLAPQLDRPLDNHRVLRDGRRLLGDNKTWKGLVGMVALGVVTFVLWSLVLRGSSLGRWDLFHQRHAATLPFDALVGALLGAAYALFELPNSFLKRRLDIGPGKESTGPCRWFIVILDQADSVLGCAVVLALLATVTPLFLVGLVVVGAGTHILLNMALFAVGLRRNRF